MPPSPPSPLRAAKPAAEPKNAESPLVPHPRTLSPANLFLLAGLSVCGAAIGIELLVKLGVTPNTALIGAVVAMICARVPLRCFAAYRSVHLQNLAQTAISSATFGAANSLLLPIGIPYLMDRPDLVMPMFCGVALAMLLDGYMLYRMFGSKIFPETNAWPPGIAAAAAIEAANRGGKQAGLLGAGLAAGIGGAWLGVPMSAFGIAFLGNVWALGLLGMGFLLRGYSVPLFGLAVEKAYIPHGMMIGAGLVALCQVAMLIWRERHRDAASPSFLGRVLGNTLPGPGDRLAGAAADAAEDMRAHHELSGGRRVGGPLIAGGLAYIALAALVSFGSGLYDGMSTSMLLAFIVYAAFAAFFHQLIVGIAAMHSGWFPAFAVALISLLVGMLLGFPPTALVVLSGFSAATGPAFADMGYDLKAGFILRGSNAHTDFEREGRRQQLLAAMLAFVLAIPVVYVAHLNLFANGQMPPVARVYSSTIRAGINAGVMHALLLWAIAGAALQLLGGPKRQLGVLFATGMLIANPAAGWALMIGIALRAGITRFCSGSAQSATEVIAAGVIAGDAVFSFCGSLLPRRAL